MRCSPFQPPPRGVQRVTTLKPVGQYVGWKYYADTAGEFADTAGEFADTAGEFADTAGEFADTAGEFADTEGEFAARLANTLGGNTTCDDV
eukprot:1195791-Prorocentrum_minimum.AAC.13